MRHELTKQLSLVDNPDTLADLFGHLGYEPCVQELSDSTWLIARYRSFRIVGRFGISPDKAARKLVRSYANGPERVLGAAVANGGMALCTDRIGAPGITRTLSMSLTAPNLFQLQQLRLLEPANEVTSLAHALRVAEVLDSEPAGDRFYSAFRDLFRHMCESKPETDADTVRSLVFIALTRVLFLYFVQARGWLNGDPHFIRSLFDTTVSRGNSFHADALNPLFFATLNTPHEHRKKAAVPGNLPYLNGGLFAPHPEELEQVGFEISNELWRDALDDVFERFRFCSSESTDPDAIAPDMLGRVFERLGAADRKKTGTYYTPETIVERVFHKTLAVALSRKTGISQDKIDTLLNRTPQAGEETQLVHGALKELTVLDPAVGSGAFLMTALSTLADLRRRCGDNRAAHIVRREVVRDNLFGVDLDPMAVRLSELRLWLAIAAEDPAIDPESVEPLPNLDGVLRQGDSLLDPSFECAPPSSHAHRISEARTLLFEARGERRETIVRDLRNRELKVASYFLRDRVERLRGQLAEADTQTDLDGSSSRGRRAEALQVEIANLEEQLRSVDRGALPFFSYDWHCPDVLQKGGFDVVTGNPPWVRAETLAPSMRARLQKRFNWWKGSARRGYAHQPDLAVAFLQRSVELCREDGAVGLLLPSKVATASYAATARYRLVAEARIAYLERFSERDGKAFGATAYPMTLVVNKTKRNDSLDPAASPGNGPWILTGNSDDRAINRFLALGEPTSAIMNPGLGVKTGADRYFVGRALRCDDDYVTLKLGAEEVTIEKEVVRPVVRGRDVKRFGFKSSMWIVWCLDENGRPVRTPPPLARRYFESVRNRLLRRADYKSGPPWIVFRTAAAVSNRSVIWADLSRRSRATVNDGTVVPLNTCYHASTATPDMAFAFSCVLNSIWTDAVAVAIADEARGGYRRFNAHVVGMIPFPTGEASIRNLATIGRSAIKEGVSDDDIDDAVANALDIPSGLRHQLRAIVANHG